MTDGDSLRRIRKTLMIATLAGSVGLVGVFATIGEGAVLPTDQSTSSDSTISSTDATSVTDNGATSQQPASPILKKKKRTKSSS